MVGTENSLAIYLGDHCIASLSIDNDKLSWQYSSSWQENGFPLSPHLPLKDTIPTENIERFLRNLLPEGNGLEELLRSFHLSKYNTFGLIRALGNDIPGALIILPQDTTPSSTPTFRLIKQKELEERLQQQEHQSLIIWDNKPRLSSAGVQDKINIYIDETQQWGFGEGSLCSTHILKFEKKRLSHLVLNEFITMQLAKHCGLTVAEVELIRFGQFSTLLVSRFDRKLISTNIIKRHHIIDGCQALNLPPDYKYERIYGSGRDVAHIRDGASYTKLFQFADQCSNPTLTKLKMLDWALFNALVYNYDAHGKNISFFVDNTGIKLAPFYDLVNIKMYPDFENELSMAFGDEFDPEGINAYQLANFADDCHLNRRLVSKRLDILANKLSAILNNGYKPEMNTPDEINYFSRYRSIILKRCQHLYEQSKLIYS